MIGEIGQMRDTCRRAIGKNNKMTNFKSLTIWTIVFDFFIIVGAGHGLLCIGIMEMISIVALFTGHIFNNENFSLSPFASYEQSLIAVGLFSLFGQLLVLVSFFNKGQKHFWIKLLGLLFMWLGFYYLTHNFVDDDLSQIGFWVGIPFLISSGLLTYKIIKSRM